MKRKTSYLVLALAACFVLNFSACDKPVDCDKTPNDESCPPIVDDTKPDATITVKNYAGKEINSYSVLAVIGSNKEDMDWFDYKAGKQSNWKVAKPTFVDGEALETFDLDTFYMRKTSDNAGQIILKGLESGTYHLHIVDGNFDMHTETISITKDADEKLEYQTAPLGRLVVETRQSSTAGSNINGVTVALFGTGGDTTNKVLKKSYGEVEYSSYFLADSKTHKVRNIDKDGLIYWHFIPVREYFAVAFHTQLSKQKIPAEYIKIKKNNTTEQLLHFQ